MIAARSKAVQTSEQLQETAANWAHAMQTPGIDIKVSLKPTGMSGTPQDSLRLFEDLEAMQREQFLHEQTDDAKVAGTANRATAS
jgi:hypothetical protein